MKETKDQLVELFFKTRNFAATATSRMEICPTGLDINLPEFFLMQKVAELDSSNKFNLQDIRENLCISKSGISKMLAALEKKGYLLRDTDKNNRRNLIITLTEKGRMAVETLEVYVDRRLSEHIALIGEDDLKQLFLIINRIEAKQKEIEKCCDFYHKKDIREDN